MAQVIETVQGIQLVAACETVAQLESAVESRAVDVVLSARYTT